MRSRIYFRGCVRPSVSHTRVEFLRNGPNLNEIASGIRKCATSKTSMRVIRPRTHLSSELCSTCSFSASYPISSLSPLLSTLFPSFTYSSLPFLFLLSSCFLFSLLSFLLYVLCISPLFSIPSFFLQSSLSLELSLLFFPKTKFSFFFCFDFFVPVFYFFFIVSLTPTPRLPSLPFQAQASLRRRNQTRRRVTTLHPLWTPPPSKMGNCRRSDRLTTSLHPDTRLSP